MLVIKDQILCKARRAEMRVAAEQAFLSGAD
jgi:hypothetical protein